MDLTEHLLEDLQRNLLFAWLDSADLAPAYGGQSILNIPGTICSWFGLPPLHAGPLRSEITAPVEGETRAVLLLVVDALALHLFQRYLREGKLPAWQRLAHTGILAPLTSVVPSTTSAAITTLWTGRSPAEHGVVGYELWLKEYGLVANMITQAPMVFKPGQCSLQQAGFQPENALPFPTLGEHLAAHGVQSVSFQPQSIAHSGLSRTVMKKVELQGYGSPAELWVNLRRVLERTQDEQVFVWVYSGIFDELGHRYGPDDERTELAFLNFTHSFEHNFLDRLGAAERRRTVLALTADHGMAATPSRPELALANHPAFLDALHILPTGEHRFAYLYIRPGKERFVREYVDSHWQGFFSIHESGWLLESGLLGPGNPDPRTSSRMGDLVLTAHADRYLWWSAEENRLLGRHGGLSPQEMLVPFLAARL